MQPPLLSVRSQKRGARTHNARTYARPQGRPTDRVLVGATPYHALLSKRFDPLFAAASTASDTDQSYDPALLTGG